MNSMTHHLDQILLNYMVKNLRLHIELKLIRFEYTNWVMYIVSCSYWNHFKNLGTNKFKITCSKIIIELNENGKNWEFFYVNYFSFNINKLNSEK